MSDQNNENKTQPLDTEAMKPQAMRKTSAVPLRKETVRVTLKSTPAGAKPPAPSAPGAPAAPAPKAMSPHTGPQTAQAPSMKNPNIPDVTSAVPLKEETMRVTLKAEPKKKSGPVTNVAGAPAAPAPAAPKAPAPAPTVPLNVGAGASAPTAPKIAAPAPTVPLNVGAGSKVPSVPLATQPLGNASQPLPKATVQLQQTQQLDSTPEVGQAPTIQTAVDEETEEGAETSKATLYLAVAALVLSFVCLLGQYQHAKVWMEEDGSSLFSSN